MIGREVGVDAGVAYVTSDSSHPLDITSYEWNFIDERLNGSWAVDAGEIFHPDRMNNHVESMRFDNIYSLVRFTHSIK